MPPSASDKPESRIQVLEIFFPTPISLEIGPLDPPIR